MIFLPKLNEKMRGQAYNVTVGGKTRVTNKDWSSTSI